MRWLSLSIVAIIFWFGGVAATSPQGKDKKPDDKKTEDKKDEKKKPPKITEIAGKTLDDWIKLIPSKDRSESAVAIETVLLFGPEQAKKAVPELLGELRKHKPGFILDLSIRINASQALGLILSSIEKPDPGDVKEAVRLLRNLLATDEQRIVKHRVTQALGQLGPMARDAIPELLKTTKDIPTWQTRHAAVLALGRVAYDEKKPVPREVLTHLYDALKDSASQVKLAAIQSLDALEVPDIKSERALLEKHVVKMLGTKDLNKIVRIKAYLLLFTVDPDLKSKRCAAIANMIDDADVTVRLEAIQAIGNIGEEAKSCVPRLMKAIDDKDQAVALWSVWALGEIGPAAAPALKALENINKDKKHPLQKPAEDAIEKITKPKKKETPK